MNKEPSLKEKILNLVDQGVPYNRIAEELGCSKGTISYHVRSDRPTRDQIKRRVKTRRNKMRRIVEDTKSSVPCMDCGVHYPPFVMDFDHRPDEKKLYNIGTVSNFPSEKALLEEIAKCDVVCSNCHRYRTWRRLTDTEGSA